MARSLTLAERALLDRFREVEIPSKKELQAQLDAVEIASTSSDYLDLVVPPSVPRIPSAVGLPLDGWYGDVDGTLVNLILHVAFPEGRLKALERYRVDGEPIMCLDPDPAEVRIGVNPLDGPDQSATFDPEKGWRRLR